MARGASTAGSPASCSRSPGCGSPGSSAPPASWLGIRSLELVRPATFLQADLEGLLLGAYLADHMLEFAQENEASDELFRLLDTTLEALAAGVDRDLAGRYYELWVLRLGRRFPERRRVPRLWRRPRPGRVSAGGGRGAGLPALRRRRPGARPRGPRVPAPQRPREPRVARPPAAGRRDAGGRGRAVDPRPALLSAARAEELPGHPRDAGRAAARGRPRLILRDNPRPSAMKSLQQLILTLSSFWADRGCVLQQPYDLEVGAGTMHPDTLLRVLGPEPWSVAYVQPSRRPADARYGENPFRLGKHYQFQVILKPSPVDVQALYVASLEALGIDLGVHDLRFEEDNWEAPTLGAWGLGWQVMLDGMEITQFTYFQQAGGLELAPISAELTYGLERLTMFLGLSRSVYEIDWVPGGPSYGQVRRQDEVEFSRYYFEVADVEFLQQRFDGHEREAGRCLEAGSGAAGLRERAEVLAPVQRPRRPRRRLGHRASGPDRPRPAAGGALRRGLPGEPRGAGLSAARRARRGGGAGAGRRRRKRRTMADGELLLEVRCEEIPARMLRAGIEQLGTRLFEELMALRLTPRRHRHGLHAAPAGGRRCAVCRERQEDREEQLVGPPVAAALDAAGEPTAAAVGFARKVGVDAGCARAGGDRHGRVPGGDPLDRRPAHGRDPRRADPARRRRPELAQADALGRRAGPLGAAGARRRRPVRRRRGAVRAVRRRQRPRRPAATRGWRRGPSRWPTRPTTGASCAAARSRSTSPAAAAGWKPSSAARPRSWAASWSRTRSCSTG